MFNSKVEASASGDALLFELNKKGLVDSKKPLVLDIAYKHSESLVEQLLHVAEQRGLDDFDNFWLWYTSSIEPPDWFKAALNKITTELLQKRTADFIDLDDHLKKYEDYIEKGYNVILVSHSQGNFYANQILRRLPNLIDRRAINSLFPKYVDLFGNIQVATPVSATLNNSPWITFKDDLVINGVRSLLGTLPGNIQSPGIGAPPEGDLMGHNFIRAYLRNSESRSKILNEVDTAYRRLRYPIPFFQPTVVVEQDVSNQENSASIYFDFYKKHSNREFTLHYSKQINTELRTESDYIKCFELPLGETLLTAETILDGVEQHDFNFRAWPDGIVDPNKEKSVPLSIHATGGGTQEWTLGVIKTKPGEGKDPLQVHVEIYTQPQLRK